MKGTRELVTALLLCFAGNAAASCSVYVSGTNFGSYNIFSATPATSSGDIAITCLAGTPYNIKLDAGVNSSGSYYPRYLYDTFTSSTLHYYLFRDPLHSEVWGDGLSGTFYVSSVGTGGTEVYRVYGEIPPGQSVKNGTYSDAVTVLVEW